MTIIRDGKEIVLTESELVSAYYEQQHKWDVEYITGDLLEQYIDEEFSSDKEIKMGNRLVNDPEFADKVAYKYRKYLDDAYGSDTEWEDLIDAYNYICRCVND